VGLGDILEKKRHGVAPFLMRRSASLCSAANIVISQRCLGRVEVISRLDTGGVMQDIGYELLRILLLPSNSVNKANVRRWPGD
jgi:hypothetical protein